MQHYQHGDYCLLSNVWNAALADTGTQKIDTPNDQQYRWAWDWATNSSDAPISYPSVIYGIKPWEQSRSAATALPKPLAALQTLSTQHAYRVQANGQYNLAYNLWLTSATPQCVEADSKLIRVEFMLWMGSTGRATPYGKIIESCADWQLYYGVREDKQTRWDCFSFRLTAEDTGSAEINLLALLQHLIKKHGMDPTLIVADVEFGTEIWHGKGQLELQEFTVQAS